MAVFIGDMKNTSAARCALRINHAVVKIVNPAIKAKFATDYSVKHCVGVNTGTLFVARTGVRGSNDSAWVGRAANYAAKLCSLREAGCTSYITADVYNGMSDIVKFSSTRPMWESRAWSEKKINVYRSSWMWKV